MQASQGSSYPWRLMAVAKRNLLLRECVGRWWQPSRDIGILSWADWGPTCSNMQHYVGRYS